MEARPLHSVSLKIIRNQKLPICRYTSTTAALLLYLPPVNQSLKCVLLATPSTYISESETSTAASRIQVKTLSQFCFPSLTPQHGESGHSSNSSAVSTLVKFYFYERFGSVRRRTNCIQKQSSITGKRTLHCTVLRSGAESRVRRGGRDGIGREY